MQVYIYYYVFFNDDDNDDDDVDDNNDDLGLKIYIYEIPLYVGEI